MKFRKAVVLILLVFLLASSMAVYASTIHTNETAMFLTSEGTAGQWKEESIHDLTGTQEAYYGGDAGIWVYVTSVGLPSSFCRTTDREGYYECWEQDIFACTLARKYKIKFGMVNGLYRPETCPIEYTNDQLIENDNKLELFMKMYVGTVDGDTSKQVKKNLLGYRFWAY